MPTFAGRKVAKEDKMSNLNLNNKVESTTTINKVETDGFRYFKNVDDDSIIQIKENEIYDVYSTYGYYYKNDSQLTDDLFELQEESELFIIDKDTLDNILNCNTPFNDFLEEYNLEFVETDDYYEALILNKVEKEKLQQISCYAEERDGEILQNFENYYQYDGDLEFSLEENATSIGEQYSYWDGSNWRYTDLTSEFGETNYREITDELDNYENDKLFINVNRHDTGKFNYTLYNDKVYLEEVSYYRGYIDTISEVTDKLEILKAIIDGGKTEDEDFEELMNICLAEIQPSDANIEMIIDDGEIAVSYKNEMYHTEIEYQLNQYHDGSYFGSYTININEAINNIELRRKERLEKYFEEKIEELDLTTIFVSREDSLKAGNCIIETDKLITEISNKLHIDSKQFALRADTLIRFRDDNFAKRAIIKSYVEHYA